MACQKTEHNHCGESVEKSNILLVGLPKGTVALENRLVVLQKVNMGLSHDSAIPCLWIYPSPIPYLWITPPLPRKVCPNKILFTNVHRIFTIMEK